MVHVMDENGSAFSLSLWERAGVRVPTGLEKPLTLILSQGERVSPSKSA
jgi:hypothetical protein